MPSQDLSGKNNSSDLKSNNLINNSNIKPAGTTNIPNLANLPDSLNNENLQPIPVSQNIITEERMQHQVQDIIGLGKNAQQNQSKIHDSHMESDKKEFEQLNKDQSLKTNLGIEQSNLSGGQGSSQEKNFSQEKGLDKGLSQDISNLSLDNRDQLGSKQLSSDISGSSIQSSNLSSLGSSNLSSQQKSLGGNIPSVPLNKPAFMNIKGSGQLDSSSGEGKIESENKENISSNISSNMDSGKDIKEKSGQEKQTDEENDKGILEKAKDSIVDGASSIVDSVKDTFNKAADFFTK